MAELKEDVLNLIRSDENLQLAIAHGLKKKMSTVKRWIRTNDEMLITDGVVLLISKLTGLAEEEIKIPEPSEA